MSSFFASSRAGPCSFSVPGLQQVGVVGDAQGRQGVLLDDAAPWCPGRGSSGWCRRSGRPAPGPAPSTARRAGAASASPSTPGRRRASAARRRTSSPPSARGAPAAAGTARAPAPCRRRSPPGPCGGRRPRSRFSSTVIRGKIRRPSGDWQMPAATTWWPAHARESLALERHRAPPRAQQARDRAQGRGLARPVGADQGDDLARADVQAEALHRRDVAVEDVQVLDG